MLESTERTIPVGQGHSTRRCQTRLAEGNVGINIIGTAGAVPRCIEHLVWLIPWDSTGTGGRIRKDGAGPRLLLLHACVLTATEAEVHDVDALSTHCERRVP